MQGYHFTNGVRVRIDVTYPPGKTASYYSSPVVAGEFKQNISEVIHAQAMRTSHAQ